MERELIVLMSDNSTVVAQLKKWGHSVKGIVRSASGDCPLVLASLSYSVCEVHSLEEGCSGRPAHSVRPGPSHRMVSSPRGVWRNLWGSRSASCRLIRHSGKCQVAFVCVSSNGSHGSEARHLPTPLGWYLRLHLSLFTLLQVLSRVRLSKRLSMLLIAPSTSILDPLSLRLKVASLSLFLPLLL